MRLALQARVRALEAEQRARGWLAWTIESLHRSKKLPKFKDLVATTKAPSKPKTAGELFAIAKMFVAEEQARALNAAGRPTP